MKEFLNKKDIELEVSEGKPDDSNMSLFDIDPEWSDEWQDMPEFVQEKQEPYCTITVRFRNEEHLQEFSKLIGQKLTTKSSIWYPKLKFRKTSNRKWVDENNRAK